MKDIYVEKFTAVLNEVGGNMPLILKHYVSCLLAEHVEKTNFFSEPFGARYMDLQGSVAAKELADNCLVIVGIFSGYRGMSDSYYENIGISSYSIAATFTGSIVFKSLARDFNYIRLTLNQIQPKTFL
jgi:hypothetical protein